MVVGLLGIGFSILRRRPPGVVKGGVAGFSCSAFRAVFFRVCGMFPGGVLSAGTPYCRIGCGESPTRPIWRTSRMTKRKQSAAEIAAYRELARAAANLRRAQEAAERKQLKPPMSSVPTDQVHTAQRFQESVGSSPDASRLGSAAASGVVPELLTTKQAAALVGCGERTFWAWSRSGLAPAPLKIGLGLRPAVRYRRTDIMAWIAAGCPRVDGREQVAR